MTRMLVLKSVVMLLVASSLLCGPGCLGNSPSEESETAEVAEALAIEEVNVSCITDTAATITWVTNRPATGHVEYMGSVQRMARWVTTAVRRC